MQTCINLITNKEYAVKVGDVLSCLVYKCSVWKYVVLSPACGYFVTSQLFASSCSRLRLQPLSCPVMHAFFSTMCSLHSLPVGSVCFGLLLSSVVFFLPAELDIVSSSLILWQPIRVQERMDTPLIFTPAPSRGRLHEDTVYWRLCQNKNPQRGRRGAGRELCLGVYTALYSVHLHTFYFSSPIWVWTWLHIWTSWHLQVKSTFSLFKGKKDDEIFNSELQ